jgi:hypothetical protein
MKLRRCPSCNNPGIDTSLLYPAGTSCKKCGGHVEVNAKAYLLVIGTIAVVMLLAFNLWDLAWLGFLCAAPLIAIAVSHNFIGANFVPLKHYEDDHSL